MENHHVRGRDRECENHHPAIARDGVGDCLRDSASLRDRQPEESAGDRGSLVVLWVVTDESESTKRTHNEQRLKKFSAWIEDDAVWVDADEIAAWEKDNPQLYDLDAYQGLYQDYTGTPNEPHVHDIRQLADGAVFETGPHGPSAALGVPHTQLPRWGDIQIVTAQLARTPLLDHETVGTELTIGPKAAQPLRLDIPVFVSDMSFGSLSQEAKTALALAMGARWQQDLAGDGVDSARFRKPVVPGDRLYVHVTKMRSRGSVWKFSAEAKVDGVVVAEATYSAMILDKE
ncbi:MAG: hypothetical protein IIC57_04020 [Proteobacteria bacterium]|nr:hypothetical protein [Pseudomonadota bacterium]